MQLFNCQHPRLLVRPSNFQSMLRPWLREQYIACGSCPACLNRKMLTITDRLKRESKFHKYCYHVTFTASDDCLPYLRFHEESENEVVATYGQTYDFVDNPLSPELAVNLNGCECINYVYRIGMDSVLTSSDEQILFDNAKRLAGNGSGYNDNKLRYIPKSMFQLFMKRFRRHVEYYFSNYYDEVPKVRYYAVLEYSPKKLRPHIHCLLWFEDPVLSCNLQRFLRASWKFGYIKCKLVCSDRQRTYLAKYINSTSYLPPLYQNKEVRPWVLCSKCPAIGLHESDVETIKELFKSRDFDRFVSDGESVRNEYFTSAFENTWFPKCREFDSLTHYGRITRYRFYYQVQTEYQRQKFSVDSVTDLIADKYEMERYKKGRECGDISSFEVLGLSDYYRSRRVCYLCDVLLGVSLDEYVKFIDDYYSWKSLQRLSQFYNSFNDYVTQNPTDKKSLVYYYPSSYHDYINANYAYESRYNDCLFDYFYKYLGIEQIGSSVYDYLNLNSYRDMVQMNIRMNHDNQKSKVLRDELNQFKSYNYNEYFLTTY